MNSPASGWSSSSNCWTSSRPLDSVFMLKGGPWGRPFHWWQPVGYPSPDSWCFCPWVLHCLWVRSATMLDMTTKLLMGNAAAAHGALAAGVNCISGYPGTPSSELLETAAALIRAAVDSGSLAASDSPHIEWSVNEKAALELAFGVTLAGGRALVTMKQVGLNVACDPFMTIASLGVKGGLVLFVADDPGPISSQNEQDTRNYAQFAKIPLLDATCPEELYSLMPLAFRLSETYRTAVIVRATTRICHGSAPVPTLESYSPNAISGFERDPKWVIFPPLAYQAHLQVPDRLQAIVADPAFSRLNELWPAADAPAELGLVAGGVSWAYLCDALAELGLSGVFDCLKISAVFPFPDELAAEFLRQHQLVLVFEELEPTIERELQRVAGSRQIITEICGKLTGASRYAGENSVASIAQELSTFLSGSAVPARSLSLEPPDNPEAPAGATAGSATQVAAVADNLLIPRPPVLCAGCPHRASFYAIKKALRGRAATYSGDIGCYTLGNALPLDMVDSCVCMGAGFTVPQGLHWAQPDVPHLGFVGDSTFFASGITGVVNAVYNQTPITFVVLNNSVTAMTGSQPHPGTGLRMSYDSGPEDAAQAISIPRVLEALGVKQVHRLNPFDLKTAIAVIRATVGQPEVNALIFEAPCIKVSKRQPAPVVLAETCTNCGVCINSIGCPALAQDEKLGIIRIETGLCTGCDLCTEVCPHQALVSSHD